MESKLSGAESPNLMACGANPNIMFKHETLIKSLDERAVDSKKKLDEILDKIEEQDWVTIMNGDDGKTPTSLRRRDFDQTLYNRTLERITKADFKLLNDKVDGIDLKMTARHKFEVLKAGSNHLMPILLVVLTVLSIISTYVTLTRDQNRFPETQINQSPSIQGKK